MQPTTHGGRVVAAARGGVGTRGHAERPLARDWFLTVNGWKMRHFPKPSGGWLRLCVPISLRSDDHRGLPAANVVSMVFLDRRRNGLVDPEQLLRGICREMNQIKRLRLGEAFVAAWD